MAAIAPQRLTNLPRSWIERLWSSIADRGRAYADVPGAAVPALDRARRLATTLLSGPGEASGAAVARELHAAVAALDDADRLEFLLFLASNFLPSETRLRAAAEAYLADPSAQHAARLAEAAEPPR